MSLDFCILGSGSSGNATVIRSPWGAILLDAGFGPRVTAERLSGTGITTADIQAIVLTHLDHDHFNPNWLITIMKQQIRVFCCTRKRRHIVDSPAAQEVSAKLRTKHPHLLDFPDLVHGFTSDFSPLQGVTFSPIHLAHDNTGSHGFLISCDGYKAGFATDLGHVPDELIAHFCGVDFLALEANYDYDMERNSSRPWFLKQRVMGGSGHLSNTQSFDAIRAILDRTEQLCGPDKLPRHIVLLHRSRECNCPKLLRSVFTQDDRIPPRLTLTDQHRPTGWLHIRDNQPIFGQQLPMFA